MNRWWRFAWLLVAVVTGTAQSLRLAKKIDDENGSAAAIPLFEWSRCERCQDDGEPWRILEMINVEKDLAGRKFFADFKVREKRAWGVARGCAFGAAHEEN